MLSRLPFYTDSKHQPRESCKIQLSQLSEGSLWSYYFFLPEELFGFAIETTVLLVPGGVGGGGGENKRKGKKKNHFSLN